MASRETYFLITVWETMSCYLKKNIWEEYKSWSSNETTKVLYDGVKHDAYSVIRGNHQIIKDKFILTTILHKGECWS